ncbi:hypothetical protein NQ318_007210 [Aromia moschata]|uniref:Uncharacterized protein n=1 Tax=Aromia moschata TaxID=1265417 RepID=A0AAV8Y569_9CUCU|nr:hypothetical protein NQ318_007210 [Aromia moschata]
MVLKLEALLNNKKILQTHRKGFGIFIIKRVCHNASPGALSGLARGVEAENANIDEDDTPVDIVIFPPENANEEHTDEDSGEDDLVDMNNLPGSQLRGHVEIMDSNKTNENSDSETDSDEDVPLSLFYPSIRFRHYCSQQANMSPPRIIAVL